MELLERVDEHLKDNTFDGLNNCLADILAEVHKFCANNYMDMYMGKQCLSEARETTITYLREAIDAYDRKISLMSTVTDVTRLYNENKLASSVADTELSRKDSISAFKELKNLQKSTKDPRKRTLLTQLITSLKNAVNSHLRLFRNVMQQTNHEALLKGKDFSEIVV